MYLKGLIPVAILVFTSTLGCSHSSVNDGTEDGKSSTAVMMDIFYATDRNIKGGDKPKHFYGKKRGDVTYGFGQVVLRKKKARSKFAAHSLHQGYNGKPPSGRAGLSHIQQLEKDIFLTDVSHRIKMSHDTSALVYLHGYGRKFERAMRTTAIVAYEMGYRGVPILYSWPSKGSATAYLSDRTAIDWSTPHLLSFLNDLAKRTEAGTIHLMAHSLGNRAMLKALKTLIDNKRADTEWRFGEIILVAPDVDRSIFVRDYAPMLSRTESRVTLYVSTIDVPLTASRKLNRYPRVGDAKEGPTIVSGIETIDASDVTDLIIGHSYYRDSPEVLADLHYLLVQDLSAEDRMKFKHNLKPEEGYWKVIPEGDER